MMPRYRTWAIGLISHSGSVHREFATSNRCQTDKLSIEPLKLPTCILHSLLFFLFISKLPYVRSSAFPRSKHVLPHFITLHSELFTYSFVLSCCNQGCSGPFSDRWRNTESQNISSSSDRLDSGKLLQVNSDNRKQPLFLTKTKAAKKVGKAQKGCTRQLLLGWNEQSRVDSNLASDYIRYSVVYFFFFPSHFSSTTGNLHTKQRTGLQHLILFTSINPSEDDLI